MAGLRRAPVLALRRPSAWPAAGLRHYRGVRLSAVHTRRHTPGGAGGVAMMLLLVGCNFRTAPVDVRERLAFDGPKLGAALDELSVRYDCEAVILSTCNRVELYLARADTPHGPDS